MHAGKTNMWLSLLFHAATLLLLPGVSSETVQTYSKMTDPEGRFSFIKSGTIGVNIWNITVEQDHEIQLKFEYLDMDCSSQLDVYDGSTILYRECYHGMVYTSGLLTSSTNTVEIVFTGIRWALDHKYFTVIYKSVSANNVNRNCGGFVTGSEGIISTPDYPSNYDNLLICDWIITGLNTSIKIQLEIQSYDIEQVYDSIEVRYNTAVSSFRHLISYNSDVTDYFHYVSDNATIFVRFVSNWNVTRRGFQAKWTSGDTYVHFTKPQSRIFKPNCCIDGKCTWNITVEETKIVQLDINFYRIECEKYNLLIPCECSSLEVYDGPHIRNSTLLKRLCNNDNAPRLISSTNNMIVILYHYYPYMSGDFQAVYRHIEDIDECTSSPCHHICENSPGSYRCLCQKGFTLNTTTHLCDDIDECTSSPCDHNCENSPGSYRCLCQKGFTLNTTTLLCEDIDECTSSPCDHNCENSPGSYHCLCQKGFTLNSVTHMCEDIPIKAENQISVISVIIGAVSAVVAIAVVVIIIVVWRKSRTPRYDKPRRKQRDECPYTIPGPHAQTSEVASIYAEIGHVSQRHSDTSDDGYYQPSYDSWDGYPESGYSDYSGPYSHTSSTTYLQCK